MISGGGGAASTASTAASSSETAPQVPKPEPPQPEPPPPQPEAPPPPPPAPELPEEVLCPITTELMVDPVFTADGHTYERKSIELWLTKKRTSPLTGEPLAHTFLTPNHALRALCQKYAT